MNTKLYSFALVITILSVCIPITQAQPEPSFGNWELGIDYPEDDDANSFMAHRSGVVQLSFWVDNPSLTAITISFEYEEPFEGAIGSAPTEETIEAGSNDSFTLTFNQIDVFSYNAGTIESFKITASLEKRANIDVVIPESQEKEGSVEIPEIFELSVEVADPVGPMNSGTESILRVTVNNRGNSQDRVRDVEVTDDCPLMTTNEGLDVLTSRTIQPGGSTTAELKIMASDSHPSRNCRVEVTVTSNGADGAQLSNDFTRVTVESSPIVDNDDDDANSNDNEDPVEVVTTNLPAPGILTIISGLMLALLATPRRQ